MGGRNNWPNTLSPTANRVVPSPVASTTPAPSTPSTIGKIAGAGLHSPDARRKSIGFIDAAASLIRSCPGPATGVIVSIRVGGSPNRLTATARMDSPPASRANRAQLVVVVSRGHDPGTAVHRHESGKPLVSRPGKF